VNGCFTVKFKKFVYETLKNSETGPNGTRIIGKRWFLNAAKRQIPCKPDPKIVNLRGMTLF